MSDYGIDASSVKRFNRSNKNDCEVIYTDSTHLCIMKLCPAVALDPRIPLDDYRRFHIRFYIPRFVFDRKDKKVNRFIFLFNGLNELDHFTLYDQIGQELCRRGIAAALIPMPDHLHRHPKWRLENPTEQQKHKTPLDDIRKNKGLYLHERFLQYMGEVEQLYKTIKHCYEKEGDFPLCFYRNIFDHSVRVSCFGYSLGGLPALSLSLANPDDYNACFLLNAGVQLGDIKLPENMISRKEWEEIVVEVSDTYEEDETNPYSRLFGQLFLGNRPAATIKKLRSLTHKTLFIFGGSDAVIPMESISQLKPEGQGLSIFQIPGMGHFTAIDREWNNWYLFTVNLIADFEENAAYEYWSRHEMIERISVINQSCSFFVSPNEWDVSKIGPQAYYDDFYKIYYSHNHFFSDFRVLLAEVNLYNFRRENFDEDSRWCAQNLSYEDTETVLKEQRSLLRKGHYVPCGAISKEMGLLPRSKPQRPTKA